MPALTLHPQSRCDAITCIDVDVERAAGGTLRLRYVASGKIGDLLLPERTAPERADELWQHTCFEAFLKSPNAPGYWEFNFSPSMRWAAYRFDGYRKGMEAPDMPAAPVMTSASNGQTSFEMDVQLAAGELNFPDGEPWLLGLTAVIEEKNGNKSWWALTHAPGKPDFHHPACFSLELPPPE